jgi:hypothetical protein
MVVGGGHLYRGDQFARGGVDGDDVGKRAADVDPDPDVDNRLRRERVREFGVQIRHRFDSAVELMQAELFVRCVNHVVGQADADEHLR